MKADIPEEYTGEIDAKTLEAFHALNPKQQTFVLNYLKSDNATDACRIAYGYVKGEASAETGGFRLLRNDKIRTVLDHFQSHRDDDLIRIRRAYTEGLEAIKPIYAKDSEGQPEKVEDLPDHEIRIKAAKALADLHGHNAPAKKELSGPGGGAIIIKSTPADENA